MLIDIIAHSQGCVSAALAKPKGVRRAIFLAPPAQLLGLEKREVYTLRPDTVTDADGTIYMPRRDGSTTVIRNDYWRSRHGIRPIELYNAFAAETNLTIITATKDEILTNTDFTDLSNDISVVKQEANHDFTGENRQPLISKIRDILKV